MNGASKVVGIILVGGSVVVAARHFERRPAPPLVMKAQVSRGDVTQTVSATGTLSAVRTVAVGAQVSGTVKRLLVDYNAVVHQGELLAEIDSAPARQQLESARAALLQAQAALEQDHARLGEDTLELGRADALARDEQETKEDHDAAALAVTIDNERLKQDQAQITAANVAVAQAQLNVDHCTIRSPIDGVVVARDVDEGQTLVSAVMSPTIYELASDLKTLQLIGATDEADVPGLREGQDATFTVDAWPGATFHGVVRQVRLNAATVNNVVTYQSVLDVNNADLRLRPGLTAHFVVEVGRSLDVLRVPTSALRFSPVANATIAFPGTDVPQTVPKTPNLYAGSQATVWKIDGTRLVPVPVVIGRTDGTVVGVVGNLTEADTVVTGIVSGKR